MVQPFLQKIIKVTGETKLKYSEKIKRKMGKKLLKKSLITEKLIYFLRKCDFCSTQTRG